MTYNNVNRPCDCPISYESYAVATVKYQRPDSPTYDLATAFMQGTVFKELDKPFMGKGVCTR